MFTVTLLLIYYLNFKYGSSQSPELGDSVPREVRDRDYFFLWSFSAWGVWASLGLMYIWENLAALFGTFASAGAFVWPLAAAGIGLLAANAVDWRGALLACIAGLAGPLLTVAVGSPWPLVAAVPVALGLALVRTRREAISLTIALAVALVVLLALRIGVVSACHLRDEATARTLLRRIPPGRQRALRQQCAEQGKSYVKSKRQSDEELYQYLQSICMAAV